VVVSRSAAEIFGLGGPWAWVIAAVIELVGLVTSNLWLTAREWNTTKRKSDPSANQRLALGLMAAYFVTSFLLILAVEIPKFRPDWTIFTGLTALLFPVLAAVSIVAMNERAMHSRRVASVAAEKRRRAADRVAKTASKRQGAAMDLPRTARDRAVAILNGNPEISGAALGVRVGMSERWGRDVKAQFRDNGKPGVG
jgi:hypothetical protein